jgi:AraC-like DNA-binding protein
MARDYYKKMPRDGRLPRIYEVMSKYYAVIGNTTLSTAYIDSTLAANRQYEEQFNAMILLRMEQKESALQQQELLHEKEKRQQLQLRLLIISVGFIIISTLLGLLFFFYRRNRAAYRVLVRKSQEWAETKTVQHDQPLETDLALMTAIERFMSEKKPYKEASLSVEALAQTLGVKKQYLSDTIHRCTKKNFNTFVNEYRIKEAIRLISETNLTTFSFSSVVYESGFNEDRTFRRVFRKMTGLSPTDFRKNMIN